MYPQYWGEKLAWKLMNGSNLALCVEKPPICLSDPTMCTFNRPAANKPDENVYIISA